MLRGTRGVLGHKAFPAWTVIAGGATGVFDIRKSVPFFFGSLGAWLILLGGSPVKAQAADDLEASVTTGAALGFSCSQNLSFGTVYVGGSNPQAVVTLTSGAVLNSNHASVAVSGGVVGLCAISGLQGPDTAVLFLSGGGGTAADGGLEDVALSDGASHTLIATVEAGGTGLAVGNGRVGMENGVFPVFGTVTIPASHVDFGTYTTTITAMVFLN